MTFDQIPKLTCSLYGWYDPNRPNYPGLVTKWNVMSIDWRDRSVELSNGSVAIFPSIDEYKMEFESV